jgi:hypothetical protein
MSLKYKLMSLKWLHNKTYKKSIQNLINKYKMIFKNRLDNLEFIEKVE